MDDWQFLQYLKVACPWMHCRAPVGEPCRDARRGAAKVTYVHPMRVTEWQRSLSHIEKHLLIAHDPECMFCAMLACPVGEPLHFHHDGCPCCEFVKYDKLQPTHPYGPIGKVPEDFFKDFEEAFK